MLFLLRRRPFGERYSFGGGNLWALLLGAVAVAARYLFGPLVTPGGFGVSRWMSGFVDIVGLPALFPLMVCGALVMLRVFPRDADYAGFALLWLIPLAAIHSVSGDFPSGNLPPSPIPLVVVPVLWAAQAIGIPCFINGMMKDPRRHIVFFATLGIAALPIAAVTSWWAFFGHQTLLGLLLLVAVLIPMIISLCAGFIPSSSRGDTNYLEILDPL